MIYTSITCGPQSDSSLIKKHLNQQYINIFILKWYQLSEEIDTE